MDDHLDFDVYLYTFEKETRSRCEFSTDLVFNTRRNNFQIRRMQDYETQAKIEFSYSDADKYLSHHPEHRDGARNAIEKHLAGHPEHDQAMRAALARLKNL